MGIRKGGRKKRGREKEDIRDKEEGGEGRVAIMGIRKGGREKEDIRDKEEGGEGR